MGNLKNRVSYESWLLYLVEFFHLRQDWCDVDGTRVVSIFSIDNGRTTGIGEPVSPFTT